MIHSVISIVLFVAAGAASAYPADWWKPFPRDKAESWEILPQDAKPGEVILSKRRELGILSNFAETPFVLYGQRYRSIEGFWQMMKYPESANDPRVKPGLEWKFSRAQVAQMVAFDAKRAGDLASLNMKKLGINWVSFKGKAMTYRTGKRALHYRLVRQAMLAKALQNPRVKALLLKTGNLRLRPDHKQGSNPPPAWRYHEIWMEIRATLRNMTLKK